VLGALVLVLVFLIAKMWPGTSATPAPTSNPAGRTTAGRPPQSGAKAPAPPAVHLDALNSDRPKPDATERNLFRFKPKAAPPPPPSVARPLPPPAPVVPAGPPPPPAVPPISLKFIGIMGPADGEKIAILSDGRNAPFTGKEGAIIEGRYRILKIGVESVEIAYVDGRGRQTIRLTGS
jgi:hypothetical protein